MFRIDDYVFWAAPPHERFRLYHCSYNLEFDRPTYDWWSFDDSDVLATRPPDHRVIYVACKIWHTSFVGGLPIVEYLSVVLN